MILKWNKKNILFRHCSKPFTFGSLQLYLETYFFGMCTALSNLWPFPFEILLNKVKGRMCWTTSKPSRPAARVTVHVCRISLTWMVYITPSENVRIAMEMNWHHRFRTVFKLSECRGLEFWVLFPLIHYATSCRTTVVIIITNTIIIIVYYVNLETQALNAFSLGGACYIPPETEEPPRIYESIRRDHSFMPWRTYSEDITSGAQMEKKHHLWWRINQEAIPYAAKQNFEKLVSYTSKEVWSVNLYYGNIQTQRKRNEIQA